jgi:hypothetical protein
VLLMTSSLAPAYKMLNTMIAMRSRCRICQALSSHRTPISALILHPLMSEFVSWARKCQQRQPRCKRPSSHSIRSFVNHSPHSARISSARTSKTIYRRERHRKKFNTLIQPSFPGPKPTKHSSLLSVDPRAQAAAAQAKAQPPWSP